jgi:hypothetical protein
MECNEETVTHQAGELSSLTEIHQPKLGFLSTSTSQESVYALEHPLVKGRAPGCASEHQLHVKVNSNGKDEVIPTHTMKAHRGLEV